MKTDNATNSKVKNPARQLATRLAKEASSQVLERTSENNKAKESFVCGTRGIDLRL
jgi:hypothetical protein